MVTQQRDHIFVAGGDVGKRRAIAILTADDE
jgi:hypothetical protein